LLNLFFCNYHRWLKFSLGLFDDIYISILFVDIFHLLYLWYYQSQSNMLVIYCVVGFIIVYTFISGWVSYDFGSSTYNYVWGCCVILTNIADSLVWQLDIYLLFLCLRPWHDFWEKYFQFILTESHPTYTKL